MNIDASINALHSINAAFNTIPGRIFDSFHNPEAKEGLESSMTDMLTQENAFTANAKTIRTMLTVEDILLNELRE